MNLKNVLWVRNTGKILPSASIQENLFGLKLSGGGGSHEKTIDFTPVITVSDAKAGAVIDYQCKITATQSGSGDPTPSNIRPITGWTGANIHVNDSVIPVSWQSEAGTVYGGVRNLTTGELTVTHTAEVYDGTDEGWRANSLGNGYYIPISGSAYDSEKSLICNCLLGMNAGSSSGMSVNSIRMNSAKGNLLCRLDTTTDFPTLDSWKAFLAQNPMTVVYPLETPLTYTLTPTEIALLAGSNTLWSDTGDSSMTYLAKR